MNEPPRSIEVRVTPYGLSDLDTEETLCIVVDVLRACTTVAYALDAGARGVIPVETVEEATRLAATLDRESMLLCGERESVRIEGFHLGNSPTEYTPEAVAGKTLVFSTTNGARSIAALSRAKAVVAASFVTMSACARQAAGEDRVLIVCAGSGANFAREDFLCAGMLVDQITRDVSPELPLDDGARTALELFRGKRRKPLTVLRDTDHGRQLIEGGFEQDLELACEIDRFSFAPVLRDGCLVAEGVPATP